MGIYKPTRLSGLCSFSRAFEDLTAWNKKIIIYLPRTKKINIASTLIFYPCMNSLLNKIIFQHFIACLFFAFVNIVSITAQNNSQISKTDNSKIIFKIIDSVNKTYGYDIYIKDKLNVHQPTIPGVHGTEGFKNRADAEKVARFAVAKAKSGKVPPFITKDELKKLNIKTN
jgi:hypothetical protein